MLLLYRVLAHTHKKHRVLMKISKALAVIHTGTVHLSLLCPARSKDRNSRWYDIKHFQNTADSKWIGLLEASSVCHRTCFAYGSHSVNVANVN